MSPRLRLSPTDRKWDSRWAGAAIAALAIAVLTALIYPLREIAPADSLGVLYLVIVVWVSARWGAILGVLTTFVSAEVFNFFHLPPRYSLTLSARSEWATTLTFVVASLVAVLVARISKRAETLDALRRQERDARVRLVAATDEERRRIARDLHDGAQQRLVHTIVTLELASRALREGESVDELVDEALEHATQTNTELRDLVHGIMPAALLHGGLPAAVGSLTSRAPVAVDVDICPDRLSPAIEATAYFIIAEALTNIAKHARATAAEVWASVDSGTLRIEVRDNGVGGASLDGSSGLVGLRDRVDSLDGRLEVHSTAGQGTRIIATLPVVAQDVSLSGSRRDVSSA